MQKMIQFYFTRKISITVNASDDTARPLSLK